MADDFDPYYQWLGIPPKFQPPNHYRLLALDEFESNPDVIESAADQRMQHVRTFQSGPHGEASQKLLNQITAARLCLLSPAKKAEYDRKLREEQAAARPERPQPVPRAEPLARALPRLAAGDPADVYQVAPDRANVQVPVTPASRRGKLTHGRLAAITGTALGALAVAVICYVAFTGDRRNDLPKNNPGNMPATRSALAKQDNGAPADDLSKKDPVASTPNTADKSADKITILAAYYGQNINWIDVTDKVRRATAGKDKWQARVQTEDWGEPALGWPGVRSLLVRYSYGGEVQFRAAFQGELISLAGDPIKKPLFDPKKTIDPAATTNTADKSQGKITILAAYYGQNVSWIDVTDKVRRATAGKDRWQARVQTGDWGEPAPGWPGVRSLLVRYLYEGEIQFRAAFQDELISLPHPPRASHWVVEGGSEFKFSESEKGILLALVPGTSKLYSRIQITLTKSGESWSGTGDLYFASTPNQRYEAKIEILSGEVFGSKPIRVRTICPDANMRQRSIDNTSTWKRKD